MLFLKIGWSLLLLSGDVTIKVLFVYLLKEQLKLPLLLVPVYVKVNKTH